MNILDEYFTIIEADTNLNRSTPGMNTQKYTEEILSTIGDADRQVKAEAARRFRSIAENAASYTAVFLYSAALYLDESESTLTKMLEQVWEDRNTIGTDSVYAIYHQAAHLTFANPETDTLCVMNLKDKIYKWVLDNYLSQFNLEPIRINDRQHNLVVVISQQVIAFQHGPTKSTLDRCKIIMDAGYQVILINTAELAPIIPDLHFINQFLVSYMDEYNDIDCIEWKGAKIPFFQCSRDMPNYLSIKELINFIRKYKPYFAVSIASGTVFEGILSQMIPVFGIPMTQSGLAVSGATYQAYSGLKNKRFYDELNSLNIDESKIIPVLFGFSILEQHEKHSREEYGISEDDYVLMVVGGRLQGELDDAFWDVFRAIVKEIPCTKLIILGSYNLGESLTDIKDHLINLGFQDDILSIMELGHLYINPHRKGGGTSCVEAMYKGIPVVSDDYGDVASNAGNDFIVADGYDGFPRIIKQYYEDEEFFKSQQKAAIARADKLLNAEEEFLNAINEFIQRFTSSV